MQRSALEKLLRAFVMSRSQIEELRGNIVESRTLRTELSSNREELKLIREDMRNKVRELRERVALKTTAPLKAYLCLRKAARNCFNTKGVMTSHSDQLATKRVPDERSRTCEAELAHDFILVRLRSPCRDSH